MHKTKDNHNTMLAHLDSAQSNLGKQFDVLVDIDFRRLQEFLAVDKPEKEIFFFHKDHLGSSTQISDMAQRVIHHIEYMPTGELFAEQRDHWATPYKFNGKELDEETGLYYYGARYYTPQYGIWLSVDPLSDKFPHQSNYMYCSGRPVTVVDPDGRDEWEVNYGTGKLSKVNENKHYVNDKGNRITVKQGETYSGSEDLSKYTEVDKLSNKSGESIDLTKGVLGLKQTQENDYQSFSMSTHSEAEKMYYFWAESTKSEVAMCLLNNGSGHVGTDYNSDYTTMPRIYENAYGSSISFMSHSHTDGSPPSNTVIGMGGKIGGDLYAAKYSKYSFNREVYDVQNARIYMYNRDTLDDLKLRNRSVKDIPWRKKN
ncbi:MAG: RHS repeat domain-containing protein [Bacteroidales bacterium]